MRRRPLEFEIGDHVFLKVMPKRGVVRFGKHGKLSPRFIGPFEILERIGTVVDSCHGRVSGINKICFLYSSYCRSQATAT